MKLGRKFLAICIALIAVISLSICSPVVASAKTATKGSVTATMLNVRSGPGKAFKKVAKLKKGTPVTIVSTKAGWVKVKYKTTTGYVYSKYLKMK